MRQITNQEIEQFLGTYREKYKLIKDVRYAGGEIEAELIPFLYPFTKEDSGYVNNTQINLYLSQLTYILMSICVADKEFTLLSNHLGYDEFNRHMHDRTLFFTNITLRMKKVIYKKNLPFRARMKVVSVRKLSSRIFCDIEFDLGKGSCTGTMKGVY